MLGSYLTAIQRQISEGLAIESHDPETLINGKGEYGSNRIPWFKLTIEGEILGKHGQKYNQSNSDQPQIPTESSSNKRNNDTNSCDLFLEQFRQRKRQKRAATVSTENCENLSHMPNMQHSHSDRKAKPSLKTTGRGSPGHRESSLEPSLKL